jgi:ABC-type transporter Mla subunit MlaD
MNPLLFPLRLLQQGSDDIHALATASARLAEASESLVGFETRLLDRIDAMEATTRHTLDQLRALDAAVEKLNASTATLAAAVEPLQGVSERVARIAERIPGGRGDGTPRRQRRRAAIEGSLAELPDDVAPVDEAEPPPY